MSTAARSGRTAGSGEATALFVLGFGLFMLCRRSDFLPYVPAMIIVAPIFILRFSRVLATGRSMLFTTLGFVLAVNIAHWGIFDMGDPTLSLVFNGIRSAMIALLCALPSGPPRTWAAKACLKSPVSRPGTARGLRHTAGKSFQPG